MSCCGGCFSFLPGRAPPATKVVPQHVLTAEVAAAAAEKASEERQLAEKCSSVAGSDFTSALSEPSESLVAASFQLAPQLGSPVREAAAHETNEYKVAYNVAMGRQTSSQAAPTGSRGPGRQVVVVRPTMAPQAASQPQKVSTSSTLSVPGLLPPNGSRLVEQARSSLSPEAQALVRAVQDQIPDLTSFELQWMTQEILNIYIEARPTLEQRVVILKEALAWRVANRSLLATLECPHCKTDPLSHDARCFGTDLEGDLVFMNCFALPRNLDPDGITQHMACLFELSLRRYPSAKKWTWIIDMHGFGVANMDPRTSIKLLGLLQVAYRARLKTCIVLDAPLMFSGMWRGIKPFVRPATAELISFSSYPEVAEELRRRLASEVAEKLLAEMEENRDASRAATKRWTTFWAV